MRDKTLEDFLDAPGGAAKVLAHAKELRRLAHLYREIAPARLSEASRVANARAGTVIIHAANGAIAAKLRQLSATLADGFRRRGVDCAGIEVKVGLADLPARAPKSTPKPLSGQTFQTLARLRDALPESDLRRAVEGLIRRAGRGE
ncbi:MAG: DUF721 domain-containing protein [Candidatus Accumulibacter sp.]|nr:DUF721 domain-containing protein [Accumulibacter sp.]